MSKTPIQDFIKMFEETFREVKQTSYYSYPKVENVLKIEIEELEGCIELPESLLEKEKEVIIEYHEIRSSDWDSAKDADIIQCIETFNTKEK